MSREALASVAGPLKVALFGFYGYGNFGDDLMALIFGRFFQNRGAEVCVYRLYRQYAEEYGFKAAYSIDELLDGRDLVVLGGGAAFVPAKRSNSLFSESRRDLFLLLQQCKTKGIPIYGSSLGGDGTDHRKQALLYRQALLQSAEYLTVRNPEDVELLRSAKARGDFYPDIVWQTSAFFPIERYQNKRIRIGINVYPRNLVLRAACYILPLVHLITWVRRDLDFIFIDTHNSHYGGFHAIGRLTGTKNTRDYAFSDLTEDLEILASLDLMISTRLHAGLVCMSYGIPFVSLFGERKTLLLMRNSGLAHMCYDHFRFPSLVSLMLSRRKLARLVREFRVPGGRELKQRSLGHLRQLGGILKRHNELRNSRLWRGQ